MAKRKKPTKVKLSADERARFGSLAHAFGAAGVTPGGDDAPSEPTANAGDANAASSDDLSGQPKLTVRRVRAGRGGKTVTQIAGLTLNDEALARLARTLRKKLGTGASVEGGQVIVQGALVERVATWLEARGARRVVRGN